jgi:type IV pilus assembly protein PilQ
MHPGIPRLVLVAPMMAALAVTVTAGAPAFTAGTETPALRSISSRLDGALSTVLIEASEPVAYLTSQPDPLTVLVDLRNATVGSLVSDTVANLLEPIGSVRVESANAPDGAPVARVRVGLERAAKHRVRSARNTILVEVDRASASNTKGAVASLPTIAPKAPALAVAGPAAAQETAAAAARRSSPEGARAKAGATQLRSVRIGKVDNGYSVTLAGNGPLLAAKVDATSELPHRVFLDFAGVAAGSAPAVTAVNNDDIERVRVAVNSRQPLITRVVIDLARKIPYTVETVGEELRVLFKKAVDKAVETAAAITEPVIAPPVADTVTAERVAVAADLAPAAEPPASARSETRELRRDEQSNVVASAVTVPPMPPAADVPSMTSAAVSVPAAPVAPVAPVAPAFQDVPPAARALLTAAQQQNSDQPRVFTGDPITLDFQGADLRAVLRTFAEISQGLNIIIDPSIQGTVDVSLRDVPWDQALDIILRANKLGYSVEGNIVRIVPLNVLATENEERRKLQEAQSLAGELRVLTRSISYAKAADLVPVITRSALSARGDVQVDARTNTLIIRDLADRLVAAGELITTLDRPQPQVEIEARIVQLDRSKSRDLGIDWTLGGRVDPALGTSTGLAFPNRAAVTAGTGAVDPASPTNVGIVLGSVNGAFDLAVRLRALESNGTIKVLSTPRVTTQNNIAAEITQGLQIPLQVVSNNTVTVTFKDAALSLKVTPQITAAQTVIMNILVENATPDYSETSPAQPIPAINTQRAVTTVLMADGDTTVIGGIFTKLESLTETRTPLLHRVPLLGWLFKTETRNDDNSELLIFITPRIAK